MDVLACIYFTSKDVKADIIGYLELPYYASTVSDHEIFVNDSFELQVRYYDDVKPLEDYISHYDYSKVVKVLMLNDWEVESFYTVVDLFDWERVLL